MGVPQSSARKIRARVPAASKSKPALSSKLTVAAPIIHGHVSAFMLTPRFLRCSNSFPLGVPHWMSSSAGIITDASATHQRARQVLQRRPGRACDPVLLCLTARRVALPGHSGLSQLSGWGLHGAAAPDILSASTLLLSI